MFKGYTIYQLCIAAIKTYYRLGGFRHTVLDVRSLEWVSVNNIKLLAGLHFFRF